MCCRYWIALIRLVNYCSYIIDTTCGDSVGMQYTFKVVNLEDFLATYHSCLSVFMTVNTPSGAKEIMKVPNQKVTKCPKIFVPLFYFRRASSKLHDFVTTVFSQSKNILSWAVQDPIAILQLQSLTKHLKQPTQEPWLLLWCHFLNFCAKKHNHYSRLLN